jgi:hypothetical protein
VSSKRSPETSSRRNSTMSGVGTSFVKFDVMKFEGTYNFELWQRHVKDMLVQQGMVKALYGTKPDDNGRLRLEGALGKGGGYYSPLSKRGRDVSCHGRRIFGGSLVETGKPIHVQVIHEQALSEAAVVQAEDGGRLGFEPTHQCFQSDNR